MCVCDMSSLIKSYLLGAKRMGETSRHELTKGRKIQQQLQNKGARKEQA